MQLTVRTLNEAHQCVEALLRRLRYDAGAVSYCLYRISDEFIVRVISVILETNQPSVRI